MQVLTTAPSQNLRALHASAHHGAMTYVPHARPACKCSPRRLSQNLRALPRASSSTSCGQRRRSVASSRSNVPRAPDEMHSDAIRCNQMQSDAIRCHHRRQSEPIRSHQIPSVAIRGQSEPIRGHQSESEAIQSAERAVDVERADGALSGGQELSEHHVAEHAASK